MSQRFLTVVSVVAVVLVIALAAPLPVAGQAKRTPWGEPDLQGVYTNRTLTPLERPRELGTKEFYTPEEVAEIEQRRLAPAEPISEDDRERGTRSDVHYDFVQFGLDASQNPISRNLRTSVVVDPPDGRIPPTLPQAEERQAARRRANDGGQYDGPENRPLTERCIVWSSTLPPILSGGYNSNLQIAQSPGYVVIQPEMGDARIIPTDGREPLSPELDQWIGSSVGHWEGDTLVVETTNFREETAWRNSSTSLKVTERLTRISDETVEYRFTVEDPETWERPWSGVYPFTEIEGPLFEYACHEGNYGMANILSGQRAEEAREAGSNQD